MHTISYNTSPIPLRSPLVVLLPLVAALLCAPGALGGQETGYRIEDNGRFVQVLNWNEQEDALYYEVEIEKQADALWEGAVTGKTEAPFFEFSLGPGIYRYRIRPYDLLERPGPASDWIQFEILPARQPVLARFSPEGFYLDEDIAWVLTISGRNLADGVEIVLRGARDSLIKPDTVTVGRSGNEARLTFRYDQLDTGSYAIHAMNPGGLTAQTRTFKIAFRKPMDINVSAGYRPLVPLYGYLNELFGAPVFPAGAYSRLSVIPVKRRWGYMGFELEPSWNYLLTTGDAYESQAQMPGAAIYGVYRRWFSSRTMSLDFRAGGGMYSILDYHFTFDRGSTDPVTALIPALAAGVSFHWLVKKPFFVEAGLDFTQFFAADKPSPAYLRPFAGAGWQF